MKKTIKILKISKETIYALENLENVAGGATAGIACNTTLCTRTCTGSHNTCTTFLC